GYDIPQLSVLHKGRLSFHLARYSKYHSILSYRKLLTRLSGAAYRLISAILLLGGGKHLYRMFCVNRDQYWNL
ncbi:hypothetical protein T265_12443, partial [Opisthorchis viverrini]